MTLGEYDNLIEDLQQSKNKKRDSTPFSNDGSGVVMNHSRIPAMVLPKFDGDFQQWKMFYSKFQSLFEDDKEINNIQRLRYLTSCLSGRALDVISAIEPSEEAYSIAVKALKSRFEHKRRAIQAHIRTILDIPNMSSTSATTLSNLFAEVTRRIQALKALKQPVEHWDSVLIYLFSFSMVESYKMTCMTLMTV